MPRTADHDARRRQITDGVRAEALRVGLGGVTMAGAARSAGVSVGMVQHYYANKEALLRDTFTAVRGDVLARVDAAVSRAERRHTRIEEMLARSLQQLLPLDARRREEAYLMRSFAGLALEDESLAGHLVEAHRAHRQRVALGLSNGKQCGEVLSHTDVDAASYALIALTDGLAAQLLASATRDERRWARHALQAEAARLCPGPCGHHPDGGAPGR